VFTLSHGNIFRLYIQPSPDLKEISLGIKSVQPQTYVKPEAAITVFELLMMSVVSLETC
jgi:hypothetical protein